MKKQEKILKTLKDFGRLPTARISAICNIYYVNAITLLEELEKGGKVIKDKETQATYWRLKK